MLPTRRALGMRQGAIAALAALAAATAALLPRLVDPSAPAVAAETPRAPAAQGVPVTAGTAAGADVPAILVALGAGQGFNTVTIKRPGDRQRPQRGVGPGHGGQGGGPLLQNASR